MFSFLLVCKRLKNLEWITGNCIHGMIIMLFNFSNAGPCIERRVTDTQLRCNGEGNFEPLQCRRMNDGTHTCHCVHPRNGSMVPNTMRTGIRRREHAPDCQARGTRLAIILHACMQPCYVATCC